MFLSRGIKSISSVYIRDFTDTPDTEENIKSPIWLETESGDCHVKLADTWPENIRLNARLEGIKITSPILVERIENDKSLGKNDIYGSPIIHGDSDVKNPHSFWAKVVVIFENSGTYLLENEKNVFFHKSFDNYVMDFEKKDDILFEKNFPTLRTPIVEKYNSTLGGPLYDKNSPEKASYKIYPYGGFYEYGGHPKSIELCVFQTAPHAKTTSIIVSRITTLMTKGINPFAKQILKSGTLFVGLENSPEDQKTNLYDDLKNGLCKIKLTDITTGTSTPYKSTGLTHTQNTNLITINFIQG
ncbi:MAG: hypothetical protein LBT70_00830 [Holosporaceae bacterium]|jgi:hypothetical protein|nr:hypothetical protein [Holosporaceae bacterium]